MAKTAVVVKGLARRLPLTLAVVKTNAKAKVAAEQIRHSTTAKGRVAARFR